MLYFVVVVHDVIIFGVFWFVVLSRKSVRFGVPAIAGDWHRIVRVQDERKAYNALRRIDALERRLFATRASMSLHFLYIYDVIQFCRT